MIIRFHSKFKKAYKKASLKIRGAVDARLMLFAKDPFSHQLKNHPLVGKYTGYRSINITGDYRALYKEINGEVVVFVLLGSHALLYR